MIDKMMDSIAGHTAAKVDSAPEQQVDPRLEFEGFVECPLFSAEAKISVKPDGLLIATRFDQIPIYYGEIKSFALKDSRGELQIAAGTVAFSRMGQNAQWLYQKLYTAYNKAVEKALLVEGSPGFDAEGDYSAEENGMTRRGHAVVRLYEDCLLLLPPDENARRVPLCFLTGMEKDNFSLTIALSTGERYTLRGLGRELDNLDRLLIDNLQALQEKTMVFHKELAPNLGSMQSAMATKMMPLGTAVDLRNLASTVPPLASALEGKIKESRIALTYPWLHNLCDGVGMTVGAKPAPKKAGGSETAVPPQQEALQVGTIPAGGGALDGAGKDGRGRTGRTARSYPVGRCPRPGETHRGGGAGADRR